MDTEMPEETTVRRHTVGRDEVTIRKYIQEQDAEDQRLDQLELFKDK
jgi:hypothetical protein